MKKRGFKIIDSGYFREILEAQPYSYQRLFDIFEKYQSENDFGVYKKFMKIAIIMMQVFVNEKNIYNNVYISKIRLVQID